jgi:GWxTD domain-containing protein
MMQPASSKITCLFLGLAVISSVILLAGCASRPKANLTPEEEDFLSKVRYIISGKERKIFLELPASEREKFIQEFWEKRDPDPTTEENEYKEEYFARIDEANRLFSREGRPGWLTDRGQIYILFGPPTEIKRQTGGYMDSNRTIYRDAIIWYYQNFPVIFVDRRGNGEFELTYLDLEHLDMIAGAISRLEEKEKKRASPDQVFFDFAVSTKKDASGFSYLLVEIPYKNIWFSGEKDRLETSLKLTTKIRDSKGILVAEQTKDYSLSFAVEEVNKIKDDKYRIEISLLLGSGQYEASLTLRNMTSKEELSKSFSFVIDKT